MTDPYTQPLPGSAALVLIDVQRDFYADDAPLPIEGTAAAIPAMARLASEFRDRALPIVHVVRLYRRDGSNADMARGWPSRAAPAHRSRPSCCPILLNWTMNCCSPANSNTSAPAST